MAMTPQQQQAKAHLPSSLESQGTEHGEDAWNCASLVGYGVVIELVRCVLLQHSKKMI